MAFDVYNKEQGRTSIIGRLTRKQTPADAEGTEGGQPGAGAPESPVSATNPALAEVQSTPDFRADTRGTT